MAQNPASTPENEKRRSFKDLLIWLALIPMILVTLLCCGQLAMMIIPSNQGDNTGSLLKADYQPWPYDRIPAVNVAAFMTDVVKEQTLLGTPEATIVVGDYWEIATATSYPIALATSTREPKKTGGPTATARPQITSTPKATAVVTITRTPLPTSTRRPSSTPLPTITRTPVPPTVTRTIPPPIPPTDTSTPKPRPTRTRTPTQPANYTPTSTLGPPPPPPATLTPTPTGTGTPGPTATFTFTPTVTNTPPFVTPTYAPLRPIAENDGIANQINGGCRIFFGYWNDNTNEVDIPVGPSNFLNDPAAQTNPPQPTHFQVGRVFGAFEFTWYSGLPLIWTLDNRTATVNWCFP